jgi:hypothetical protein
MLLYYWTMLGLGYNVTNTARAQALATSKQQAIGLDYVRYKKYSRH